MPPKKRQTKGKRASRNERRSQDNRRPTGNEEDSDRTLAPGESLFSEFLNGLQAASSPGYSFNVHEERSEAIIRMLEEQARIAEDAINMRFNPLIAAIESDEEARNAVWDGGDLIEAAQKLIDGIKSKEMNSRSHGSHASGTQKITWGETPHHTELSRLARGTTRRSRSADPRQRNGTQKHSSARSRSELRTNSDGFSYNIATVTPHHQRGESQSVAPILRKPKFGETAISMGGSPLLVSSDHVSGASLVLPLADGRVFNVQGNSSTFGDQLRTGLNRRTVDQLKEIQEFINNLIP